MEKAQEEIRRVNRERNWEQFHTPENLAKSIAIESGELLECFQWGDSFNQDEAIEELADVLSYSLQLADVFGVNPEDIVLKKLKKTEEKYPIDKAKNSSLKYTKF